MVGSRFRRGFLRKFCYQFWDINQARKVTLFYWLVVYRAVAVQEWLKNSNVSSICTECRLASESIRHYSTLAKGVQQRILRIF